MAPEVQTPVLAYYEYMGRNSESVYRTRHFCGTCRRSISGYAFREYPEDVEAKCESDYGFSLDSEDGRELDHYSFCPWCGAAFVDEWWRDRTIQNERAIDHYRNPGTHKGDTHEFRGDGPGCMANHWLGVSGGDEVCWCDPDVEPGIMGCVIRHQNKRYEDYIATQRGETHHG